MKSYRKPGNLKFWRNVSNGMIITFLSTLMSLVGLSCIVFFSDFSISESIMYYLVMAIHFFSIFIGSLIVSYFVGEKGVWLGAAIGFIYSIIILLLGFGYVQEIFFYQAVLYKIILGIVAGAFGGIVGVNL